MHYIKQQYCFFAQDLLLLDRSVIMRRANLNDRHRDMRLDVDNMSYEVSAFLLVILLNVITE